VTGAGDPDLDLIFAALGDPTRRAILAELLQGERTVGELAAPHAMSLAAISKHVQILARAGLVSQRRAGRERACRLEPDGLSAAFVWMQGFGAFAADDWDALERLVAALGSGRLDDALGGGEVD
jgi:DNA-binding transcriptional ArsR family regulator